MDEGKIKQVGELQINFNRRQVCVNAELIPMRRKEFAVLALLMEHPGWVHTKEQIYEAIWPDEYSANVDNAVACQVKRIRKNLGNNLSGAPYIETVWGIGYCLDIGIE